MSAPKSTAKLEFLMRIQEEMQESWRNQRLFEVDADVDSDFAKRRKFFVTFPYPYMNGRIHLGHAFTLSKCEFAAAYHRLKGERVLFPMAFHCTGMPIKASADKLRNQLDVYGCPPLSPDQCDLEKGSMNGGGIFVSVDKSKSKKTKLVAKGLTAVKSQWDIMKSIGLPDKEIGQFVNPEHWLRHFPAVCRSDMDYMGLQVDWRRSFITTDINPYYDSFVRWQMNRLKAGNYIKFGKRYTIFSPLDDQACMDHDRSTGEGVCPQEYTLIKLKLIELDESKFPLLRPYLDRAFLVAATLRPETMYGQTNVWVHPDISYCASVTHSGEVLIATERACRNLFYQNQIQSQAPLCTIAGKDLIGCGVRAPLASYPVVYCLPMMSISEDKGTAIVTSVPSDSPDDYVNLQFMIKLEMEGKFKIDNSTLTQFKPLFIITVPGFDGMATATLCEDVTDPRDSRLAGLKDKAYSKGFYEGRMRVPEMYRGMDVQKARKLIKDQLILDNQALAYYEPEAQVISRSGDECVVALCDQWYLDYGNVNWKESVRTMVNSLNTYGQEAHKNLVKTVDWLAEHACSRSYGLGSRLPWDKQYLRSDACTYDGSVPGPLGIAAGLLTDDVWDYIFCIRDDPPSGSDIPFESLQRLRLEFKYWYPVDLRCTGKDLLQNHLAYFLFCHRAIWPKSTSLWPVAIRANGLLQLNSSKMSKSTGNFLTAHDAVSRYSADGMRLTLGDAGDSVEDANFVESTAESITLRLHTFVTWCIEISERFSCLRNGPVNLFADRVFANRINDLVRKCTSHMDLLQFKDAIKHGFFEMQLARDQYRDMCDFPGSGGEHGALLMSFIERQIIVLAPFCPHVCDYIWQRVLNKSKSVFASGQVWDQCLLANALALPDPHILTAADYIDDRLTNRISAVFHASPQSQ